MNKDVFICNESQVEYDSGNYTLTDEDLGYLEPIIANIKRTKLVSNNNYLIAYKKEISGNLFLTFATSIDSLHTLINELNNNDALFTVIEI